MKKQFSNRLTKPEEERLVLLLEECGEVIQVIGKVLRHGYESYNPSDKNRTTNRSLLERELGDLQLVIRLIGYDAGDLDVNEIDKWLLCKQENIRPYLHHQQDLIPDDR